MKPTAPTNTAVADASSAAAAVASTPPQQQQQEPQEPLHRRRRPYSSALVGNNNSSNYQKKKRRQSNIRVLVIGSGMSGLACARELQSRQYQVLVVEARHRVGGRLKGAELQVGRNANKQAREGDSPSLHPPKSRQQGEKKGAHHSNSSSSRRSGKKAKAPSVAAKHPQRQSTATTTTERYHPVDLGGTLIHGIDDNPLYKLTQDLGVPTRSVQDCLLMDDSGWPVDSRLDEKVSSVFNECLEESFQRVSSSMSTTMIMEETSSTATTNGNENESKSNNNSKTSWRLNTPRSTRSTVLSPDTSSFGDLFQQVANEKSISDTALLRWHKANLEVSCGAGFDRLGWAWNEDEPFGYDGSHNAVVPSWKAVAESLAEPLDIWHGAVVKRIQIVHPPPELLEELERERQEQLQQVQQQQQPPRKKTKTVTKAVAVKPRVPIETPSDLLPTRQSRRIRGEDVNVRRSGRANKGTGANRFTVDHEAPQQLPSSQGTRTSRSGSTRKQRLYSYVQVTVELYNPMGGVSKTVVLEADAVVCTLPLGILKLSLSPDEDDNETQKELGGGVVFDPPLPVEKQTAIRKLGSGLLNKCALSFPHIFWQDSDFLGLAEEEHSYLVLNVAAYTGQPILMFMFGGNYGKEIEDRSDTEIVQDCLNIIKKICGRPPPPLDYLVTRWGHEQFSRMAFTYVPPGVDGFSKLRTMSRPLYDHEGKVPILMFAGEHTTPYHPSTIHGAFLSGVREAYRLDCTLAPEELEHLEFSEEELYQRTFLVEKKFEGSALRPEAQDNSGRKKPANQIHHQHRRRGAAGIMSFRNDSEHRESSPPTESAETNDTLSGTPRRSQRSAAGQFVSPSKNGNEAQDSMLPEDLTALEDRTLLRSVESYGTDFRFIRETNLPVYGKDSTKSLPQIQSRCHKLLRSGKGGKPSRIKNAWKSWIFDAVVPRADASTSWKRVNGRKSRKGKGK